MSDKITCSHIDENGKECSNAAKEEYGMQYCGHHKEDFYLMLLETLESEIGDLEHELDSAYQSSETDKTVFNGVLLAAGGTFLFALGLLVGWSL